MSPVYLQPGINGEGPSGRVHAGHVLTVVDVLQGQFAPIVPAWNRDVSFGWVPQPCAHGQPWPSAEHH